MVATTSKWYRPIPCTSCGGKFLSVKLKPCEPESVDVGSDIYLEVGDQIHQYVVVRGHKYKFVKILNTVIIEDPK